MFNLACGSLKGDLLGSTIARMYTAPPSVTAGQRPLCCFTWGGVCPHRTCRVIQCTGEKNKSLVFYILYKINQRGILKQRPSFDVVILIIIIIIVIMKNERRKTPTNFMCLHIFGFNNLLQALFNWHSLSFNGGLNTFSIA